ncbi:MAG: hypothetical protein QHC67_13870 [Sphingobium sp.]|uniref:hypothetical protein n=1 Tax=Sphingobium sp. TaxID=1912891 RepID=UPI0029BD563D|nr:hypothetical protein [Sphingobium sp.]MDX3910887.1 hypothetical protein [Sphingobium sp.]
MTYAAVNSTAPTIHERFEKFLGGWTYRPASHPEAWPLDILLEVTSAHEGAVRKHLENRAAMHRHAAQFMRGAPKKAAITTAEMLEYDARSEMARWYPMSFQGRLAAIEWGFSYFGMSPEEQEACLARGPVAIES